MSAPRNPDPVAGLAIVDKPRDWTSHDVVARLRRVLGTRRVGHSGTLDPMATGVLVCGFGAATRLLPWVTRSDKRYRATIRLGVRTTTDDATGSPIWGASADGVTEWELVAALRDQVGEIMQRPSQVSAVKVDGRRAYKRVRSGETFDIPARTVKVHSLRLLDVRRASEAQLDVDLDVVCSAGTYVRAIARDVGEALGCGAHVAALRRTSVGTFPIEEAAGVDAPTVIGLDAACERLFDSVVLGTEEAIALCHGRSVKAVAASDSGSMDSPVAAGLDGTGRVVALMALVDGRWCPRVVFRPAGNT